MGLESKAYGFQKRGAAELAQCNHWESGRELSERASYCFQPRLDILVPNPFPDSFAFIGKRGDRADVCLSLACGTNIPKSSAVQKTAVVQRMKLSSILMGDRSLCFFRIFAMADGAEEIGGSWL